MITFDAPVSARELSSEILAKYTKAHGVSRRDLPVLISFYSGDKYYYDAADRLREDCERLDIDCDIVEIKKAEHESWLDLCRKKVPFCLEMQRKHRRPILWIDVDSRLHGRPEFLAGSQADFAAMLRGFKYARDFDPMALSRFFVPGVLYFNHTPAGREFLELMARLEAESDATCTDDYFLQEAWLRHERQLKLLLLPPSLVAHEWPPKAEEVFCIGISGNVSKFKGQAQQHSAELLTLARRKAVFLHEALELGKSKRNMDAVAMLKRALELDPADVTLAHRIARLLRREGMLKTALVFLRRYQGSDFTDNHSRRFLADSEFEAGNFERAHAIATDLLTRGTPTDVDWARSRLLRFGLEVRALRARLSQQDRPAMWWMETPHPGNFGDILNPYIVEKLTGIPPRWAPRGKGLLAIGSIIKFATQATTVWGSGTPRMSDKLDPAARYTAVRGPLTRQLVLESGAACPEVYGDPAWFLPKLYSARRPARRYKLGLIRHFANDPEISAGDGVRLISVIRGSYSDIEAFIDEIHECDAVLTTSLHGLIVCHAYGIPARWCEVPDSPKGLSGDGTKFHDYLLSVGVKSEGPLHLPVGTVVTPEWAAEAKVLPRRQINLPALAAAAPFRILPSILRTL